MFVLSWQVNLIIYLSKKGRNMVHFNHLLFCCGLLSLLFLVFENHKSQLDSHGKAFLWISWSTAQNAWQISLGSSLVDQSLFSNITQVRKSENIKKSSKNFDKKSKAEFMSPSVCFNSWKQKVSLCHSYKYWLHKYWWLTKLLW